MGEGADRFAHPLPGLAAHRHRGGVMLATVGWVATAVFSASYFFRAPRTLRRLQAAAACLWILYGVAIHAWPVVIANVIVAAAAGLPSAAPTTPTPPLPTRFSSPPPISEAPSPPRAVADRKSVA